MECNEIVLTNPKYCTLDIDFKDYWIFYPFGSTWLGRK